MDTPVEVLSESLHKELFEAFNGAKKSIVIVSPFLTKEIADDLCRLIKDRDIICSVVTRLFENYTAGIYNDLSAINCLLLAGASVFCEDELHAKIYIVDGTIAFVGSANFTGSGLKRNYELLLRITDPNIVQGLCTYEEQWERPEFKIDNNTIRPHLAKAEKQKETAKEVKQTQKPEPSAFHLKRKKQEVFPIPKAKPPKPGVEKSEKATIWIKLVGSSDIKARQGESKEPWTFPFAEGEHYLFFPERMPPAGIKKGDIVYIVFLGVDQENERRRKSYVVGRGISCGFEREQTKKETLLPQFPREKMERWPIYLKLVEATAFPGAAYTAPPVSAVWEAEGKGRGYAPRGSHHRVHQPEAIKILEQFSEYFTPANESESKD